MNPARAAMLARKRKPAGLPDVHTVYHGSHVAPSKVRRTGLKAASNAYREGKPLTKALFASHDKNHAASFAVLRPGEKGHVYSMAKKGLWHSEPYKDFVDSQYTRHKIRPSHVQQVQRLGNGANKFGHRWKVESGSLPSHVHHEAFHTSHSYHTAGHHVV